MDAIAKLSALGQPTRLDIFMAIAKAAKGLSSTAVAEATGTLPTNTSVHLAILRNAGLVVSRKEGRTVIYTADRTAAENLASFIADAVSA